MPENDVIPEDFPIPVAVVPSHPIATLQNLSPEEVEKVIADSFLNDLRAHRNALLAETDWTQNPDVPDVTKQKWVAYRQALRDITLNYSSLNGAIWPQKP